MALLFLSAWSYAAVLVDELLPKLIIIAIVFFLVVYTIEKFIAPLWSDYLIIDETGFRGRILRRYIDVHWKDVKAIWQPEAHRVNSRISLSTVRGLIEIFIGHLGIDKIWSAFHYYGPLEIFESGKFRETIDYIKLHSLTNRLIELIDFPLRSTHYPARVVGWIGLGLGSIMVLMSLYIMVCFLPVYVFMVGLSLLILFSFGSLEIDPESITYSTWLGRYQIQWDEIRAIEQEPTGGWLLLHGNGKRLGIPGLSTWSGRKKEIMQLYFRTRLLEKDIVITKSFGVNFRFWSKNCRISKGS